MKVHELIDWLQQFEDQYAIIEVVESSPGTGYYDQGGVSRVVEFDPDQHTDYEDMRGNPWVTPDKTYYERRSLLLGVHDA